MVYLPAKRDQHGFTLVEITVVGLIIGLIAAVGGISLLAYRNHIEFESALEPVVLALELAQSKSVAVKEDTNWGVYFNEHYYTLFPSPYNPVNGQNVTTELPEGFFFSGPNGTQVVFSKLRGHAEAAYTNCLENRHFRRCFEVNRLGTVLLDDLIEK